MNTNVSDNDDDRADISPGRSLKVFHEKSLTKSHPM